jgi:hypothetical protein
VDETTDPIRERSDIAKAKRNVFHRHLAHEGIMLDRMVRQLGTAERMQKFAVSGNTEDLKPTPEEIEDMGVQIGNEIHYHVARGDTTSTLPAATPQPQPTPCPKPPRKMGWLAKSLIAAGMLGSGAGLGYLVNDYLSPAAGVDTDTDNITEVDFPD